jgi:hypothetical protein
VTVVVVVVNTGRVLKEVVDKEEAHPEVMAGGMTKPGSACVDSQTKASEGEARREASRAQRVSTLQQPRGGLHQGFEARI